MSGYNPDALMRMGRHLLLWLISSKGIPEEQCQDGRLQTVANPMGVTTHAGWHL